MSDPTLRPGTPEDAPTVADIWHRGWHLAHAGHVPDGLTAARTLEAFRERSAQRVADTTVAELDGHVVGFVMVVGDEVEQVYVDPAHHGSGVARPLLDEAERQVAAAGHDQAWLAAVAGNARARRFYEKRGWSDAGDLLYDVTAGGATYTSPCRRYVKAVVAADRQHELPVHLSAWILQDGNYADFEAGTIREFALELFAPWDRPMVLDPDGQPGWEATGSAGDVRITGDILFVRPEEHRERPCIVIDFGLRAYSTHRIPTESGRDVREGDRVTGVVSVGVDPFFYFEELVRLWPEIPELIYRWEIRGIEIDESPAVEITPEDSRYPPYRPKGEGPVRIRDPEDQRWRTIDRTRMWDDEPDGLPSYRLCCLPTDDPPAKDFRLPRR